MSAYILSPYPQGTKEWLLARAGKATSSRAGCVNAVGKTKGAEATTRRDYRIQLVSERLTGEPQEDGYVSRHMLAGKENEPIARMEYEAHTGEPVVVAGFAHLPSIPAGASVDGFVSLDGFMEIKCPKPATHISYLTRARLPPEHVDQVVHQFWITDKKFCEFVSFCPSLPGKLRLFVLRVERAELEKEITAYVAGAMQFLAETRALEVDLQRRAA